MAFGHFFCTFCQGPKSAKKALRVLDWSRRATVGEGKPPPQRLAALNIARCTMQTTATTQFLHERLQAYVFARKFYQTARVIREQLPRGLGEVRDQLYRASSSVSLAIAEGANASHSKIKTQHFKRALASAGECAAALDQIEDEGAAPTALL